jgi:4-hydroxyphenylpyruvate dioxygenase-like putative hemolysin
VVIGQQAGLVSRAESRSSAVTMVADGQVRLLDHPGHKSPWIAFQESHGQAGQAAAYAPIDQAIRRWRVVTGRATTRRRARDRHRSCARAQRCMRQGELGERGRGWAGRQAGHTVPTALHPQSCS